MGRPRIYATKEKAADAKRIQNKESEERQKAANPQKVKAQIKKKNAKQRAIINSNPQKKARVAAQKKASKDRKKLGKQLVNLLSAILEIKRNETNPNFQKALKTVRQFQSQSLAEQAEMFDYNPSK